MTVPGAWSRYGFAMGSAAQPIDNQEITADGPRKHILRRAGMLCTLLAPDAHLAPEIEPGGSQVGGRPAGRQPEQD